MNAPAKSPPPIRAAVYLDGFNLYFGMKSKGWQKYYWLDIYEFGNKLVRERQLVAVKYFTANVKGGGGKVDRQQAFLSALRQHSPQLEVIKGKYLQKSKQCYHCLRDMQINEEEMTDVNIATHLVNDAWKDVFDVAVVVSGDSDLVPPIATVKAEFPSKSVLVAFPPNRASHHLKQTTTTFSINEKLFRTPQMPDEIEKPDGTKLHRPPAWH